MKVWLDMNRKHVWFWGMAMVFMGGLVHAESARVYEIEGFGAFLDGNPESTSVGEEGFVMLPPQVKEMFSDASHTYTSAVWWNNAWVLSRADEGAVVAVDHTGHTREVYVPSSGHVTAMAVIKDDLWVALGPKASVVKINAQGKTEVVYTPSEGYVWSMVPGPAGTVFMATGNPGTVVKWSSQRAQEVVFKSRHGHLRGLVYAEKMGWLVGSTDNGVVYVSENGTSWKALFDTGLEEVTALSVRAPYVYVSAASGAEALALSQGKNDKDRNVSVRSQVVQVDMQGNTRVLAGSTDEVVFDTALAPDGGLWVVTGTHSKEDPRGRLYNIDTRTHRVKLLYQSASKQLTQMLEQGAEGVVVLAAGSSRLLHVGFEVASEGVFISPVHDMVLNAQVGAVSVLGAWPVGSEVRVFVRVGRTQTPDAGWSAWSEGVQAPQGGLKQAMHGRFVQFKVHLKGSAQAMPQVQRVRVAYQRQNVGPFIREVTVLRKGLALQAVLKEDNKTKTFALTEKPSAEDVKNHVWMPRREVTRVRQTEEPGAVSLRWTAEDPNEDVLLYTLSVRKWGESAWRVLKKDFEESFYQIDSSQLGDGHYQFQVQVSDALSQPSGLGEEDVQESRVYTIDNTAPVLAKPVLQQNKEGFVMQVQADDAMGPLVQAVCSLDGGAAYPLLPVDGVLDTGHEVFKHVFVGLSKGAHTATVRVVDEAGNVAFAEHTWVAP
jgi:hypothetical protein